MSDLKNIFPKFPFTKIILLGFILIISGTLLGAIISTYNPIYIVASIVIIIAGLVTTLKPNVGAFLLLASLFTFEFTSSNFLSFNVTISDVLVLCLFLANVPLIFLKERRISLPFVLVLFISFLFLGFISAISNNQLSSYIPRFIQFCGFGLASFLFFFLYKRKFLWKEILFVLVIGNIVFSIIIIYTTVFITKFTKEINILNTNSFGFFLDLIFPILLAFTLKASQLKQKLIFWPCTIISLLGILATLSRGSYIGLILSIALILILTGPKNWFKVLPIGIILVVLISNIIPDEAISDVTQRDTFTNNRAVLWSASLNSILQNPLIGIGPIGINNVIDVESSSYIKFVASDPHNFILRVGAENGIIGLILVLLIIGISFRRMLINYFSYKPECEPMNIFNLGMAGGMLAYMGHSFFDVFWVRGSGMLFWIFIGLAYASASIINSQIENN